MNKTSLRPKFKILVLAFVEEIMLIRIKTGELSSFKTLAGIESGNLKTIVGEESL